MRSTGKIRRTGRSAAVSIAGALLPCLALCLAVATSLQAQVNNYAPKQLPSMSPAMATQPGQVDTPPPILSQVGIAQHLNYQLPLDLKFTDDHGNLVPLSNYFGKIPALFMLVYYQCPMLCSEELEGLTSALQMVSFRPGKDFNIIVISIDPTETTAMAAAKKREYVKMYGHPETANGWHFMTGTQANIDKITDVVGFKYVKIPGPDGKLDQFAHASSLQIVTPEGKLAQYYMGVEYSPKDMLLGLDEASSNRIGSPVDNILTYCYHYDPQTNTHSLIVARVVQLGGALTLLMLGGFMTIMLRKDFHQGHAGVDINGIGKKVNG